MSIGSRYTQARIVFIWRSRPTTRSSIARGRARFCRASGRRTLVMLRSKRLRPERAAGGKRREAAPASESAWGWDPTRSDKYGPNRLRLLAVLAMCLVAGGACRQDMHNQPKYRGLRPSEFFADGSSARRLSEGTAAGGTHKAHEASCA